MSDSPWVKWYTDDFLGGIASANLKADEIGVYAVVLTLIADRGAPIEDDRAWVAGRAGTSTRRLNQIIDRLTELGKLQVRNGMIGNKRMLAEVKARDKKSTQARAAAFARWRDGEQPQLNLEDIKPGKNDKKPLKSAISDNADALDAKAKAKTAHQNDLKDGKNQQEREISAIPSNADALDTHSAPESDAENRVLEIKSRTNGLKVENKRGKNDKKRENSAIPETIPHDFPSCARARSESQRIERTNDQDSEGSTRENDFDRSLDLDESEEEEETELAPDQTAALPLQSAVIATTVAQVEVPTGTGIAQGKGAEEAETPHKPKMRDGDLIALLNRCADAAGFYPNSPNAIAREIDIVKRWRDAGVSFEETIVPAIRAKISHSNDPTSSLNRFDRDVMFEHAKRKIALPSEYRPPASPILEPDDEDPAFRPLRKALLEALGVEPFCLYVNHTRFADAGDCGPGRKVIKIIHKSGTAKLDDFDRTTFIRRIAKRLGFTDVW